MPTYVYGVTDAEAAVRGRRGVEAAETRVVSEGELGAIVATLGTGDVAADRANLTAHSDVLQDAFEHATVVPLRFGTIFESDDAVRATLLGARRAELTELLERVRDRVELTFKAYYVEDAVLPEIVAGHPEIARLRQSTQALPGDAGYYERIRLGELVAAALERRRREDATALLARLRPLAEASQDVAELPEWMVTKASFLVRRDDFDGFSARVEELAGEQAGRMKLTLVGPLPPYSFVDLPAVVGVTA